MEDFVVAYLNVPYGHYSIEDFVVAYLNVPYGHYSNEDFVVAYLNEPEGHLLWKILCLPTLMCLKGTYYGRFCGCLP